MLSYYEFFAGGGMARAGLGRGWNCLFANDVDAKKGFSYQANWGTGGELRVCDIRNIHSDDLPGHADMAWASFPCQDLSLAGGGAGLKGARSSTFFPFWNIVRSLSETDRAPRLIVLENVCGTLTSHSGHDFAAICGMFKDSGYKFGAVVIDAAHFLPQSRSRLFLIGVLDSHPVSNSLIAPGPIEPFHPRVLRKALEGLPDALRENLLWWNLPIPKRRLTTFSDIIEDEPQDVDWHTPAETRRLLGMMSPINLAKVSAAKRAGRLMVGSLYKRTRPLPSGERIQRAEVRFDDIAGCLRTPGGGSSRQTILLVNGDNVRTRLMSARETARLMGLDDQYRLPKKYNEAYHLTGDGVAVPVVRHIARHVLEPLLQVEDSQQHAAAG
jgi:DNA (cytosine-5)-methyltransferase 1